MIRELSSPLEPLPTDAHPNLPQLAGIRAVVFDVYGTLLVSGSGDISLTSGAARGEAASEALATVGLVVNEGQQVVDTLLRTIKQAHADSPVEFPEVNIIDIWRTTLKQLAAADTLQGEYQSVDLSHLAVQYECRVNPIWPMPGLVDTLTTLRAARLLLGIVSNAQFFTPEAFEPLVGSSLPEFGFKEPFCVWSFDHLQAKPGEFLYRQAAAALSQQGVTPEQVLYVGNDMLNDVWPAQQVGFKTALFAGDARSLRWREGDSRLTGVEPDAVVTELSQILTILSLADG